MRKTFSGRSLLRVSQHIRIITAAILPLVLLSCSSDDGTGLTGGDFTLSGVWRAQMQGTVFVGDDGSGHTNFTLSLTQSGTQISGTESFTDSQGRSGSVSIQGTLNGMLLQFTAPDFDSNCGGRTGTASGSVSGFLPGATYVANITAPAGGSCPALQASLTYTKQ